MAVDLKTREPAVTEANVVQSADAQCTGGAVTLTFDVAATGGMPQRVQLLMPGEIAREFALKLVRSAAAATFVLLCLVGSLDNAPPPSALKAACVSGLADWPRPDGNIRCGAHKASDYAGLRRRAVSPHSPMV
jgi:hypothetical protein